MKKFVKYLLVSPICLATILPITSCGCSLIDPVKDIIPEDKLKIENGVLSGFVDGFDPTQYKELKIPDKVQKVSEGAFNGKFKADSCSLTKITIPSSVKEIASKAFYSCNAILKYDLSGLKTVDGYTWASDAFGESATTGSIIYPTTNDEYLNNKIDYIICDAGLAIGWFDTTKTREVEEKYFNIQYYSQTGAIVLEGFIDDYYLVPHHELFNKLTIPSYITQIAKNAFFDDNEVTTKIENIRHLSFSTDLETEKTQITSIGDCAFAGAKFTNDLVIPYGITKIGDYAFGYCKGLPSLTFNEGLLQLGTGAFRECTELKEITFPTTIEKLGLDCFRACSKLTYIDVDKLNGLPSGWDSTNTTWKDLAKTGNIVCNPMYSKEWLEYFYKCGISFDNGWSITDKVELLSPYTPVADPLEVSETKTAEQIQSIYYTALKYYTDILADDIYYSLSKWIASTEEFEFTKFRVRVENPSALSTENTISFIMYYDIEGTVIATGDKFAVENGMIKFRDIPFKSLLVAEVGSEEEPCKSLICSGFDGLSDEWLIKSIETLKWTPTVGAATETEITTKLDSDTIQSKLPFSIKTHGVMLGLNWFINKPSDKCNINLLSSYLSKIEITE